MKLFELFNKGVEITWDEDEEDGYAATFSIGDLQYRFWAEDSATERETLINNEYTESEDYVYTWGVGFSLQSENGTPVYTNTGTGNQFLVYTTVFQCIRELMDNNGERALQFDAADSGRQALYRRFVAKFLPSWEIKSSNTTFFAVPPGYLEAE